MDKEFKLEDLKIYARFWSKVKVLKKNQCWEWQSSITPNGYGKFSIDNYPHSAHVVSYIFFNNDHDKSMCIDHSCMNRKCVNPNHLRQVTRRINNIENSNSAAAINYRKTHCVNGHQFTEENTIERKGGTRICRECRDIRNENRYKKARQTKEEIEEILNPEK